MPKKTSQKRVAEKRSRKLTIMQRFGLFFYDRRELTFLYVAALLVFGILSYAFLMQRQGFPGVDVPVSTVTGTYFVNDREKVDADITKPVTEAISKLPEVETVTSQASANFFVIITQYKEGTPSQTGNDLIKREIERQRLLPESTQAEFKPINATKFANEFDVLVAVYQEEDSSAEELTAKAEQTADELHGKDGIEIARVLNQIESGVDPRTGQSAVRQRSFDRVGVREGNEIKFYPSATIGIVGRDNSDMLELSDGVNATIENLQSKPGNEGTEYVITADFAEEIRSQISGLQLSLLEGLAAVALVCFLLISWRASITAATSMLTVILVTLGILYLSGNTLNTITLFALILSLGLIVDDTIIMVEAIDAAKTESRRKREIISTAIKRVALASTAGTLTTMLAFAPMLFVGGILGDFIRIMPVTVIIALAVSLIISITLVPLLASGIILRNRPRKSRNPILKIESFLSNVLAGLVKVAKRSRIKGSLVAFTALGIATIMVVAGVLQFQKLKFDIFPATSDSNALELTIGYTPGTTISKAQEISDGVNNRVGEVLGGNIDKISYWNTGSTTSSTIRIDLVDFDEREVTAPQFIDKLNKEFETYQEAKVQMRQIDVGPPEEELPFKMQVYSEDEAKALSLAEDISEYLNGRSVERRNGTTATVTRAEVINRSQLTRIDSAKTVEIGAAFDADDTSALVTAAQEAVEQEYTPERLSAFGLGGEALQFNFGMESQNQESFSTLIVAFPILLAVMFLLVALQFRSFLQPFLIFMAIPFSIFGVAYGLEWSDNPLSFFVFIGFFALIGISVNNTILLTDYANRARREGLGRVDAIAYSIRARFRPLITTSLTSVVALVPLALSDPFWESLSMTLIFGLLSSSLLVVIAFPYVYLGGEVIREIGRKMWRRELPRPLQIPADVMVAPIRVIRALWYVVFRRPHP